MWSLLYCRRTSLVSPYVRNVGESNGSLRILLCRFLVSGFRKFSSVEAFEGCDEGKPKRWQNLFTDSYLMKSCWLSLESAKSISRYIRFNSPENPDSVLELLKKHGFTRHQIAKVVKSYPAILIRSVDGVLLPKLEFLGSVGLSGAERTKLITSCPKILAASLHNKLIPCYTALKTILTRDEIVRCLKRASWLLMFDVQNFLASKVSILSGHGVPQGHIKALVKFRPGVLSCAVDKFDEIVKRVNGLGFDPTQVKFVCAVAAISQLQESTWDHKIKVYKSLGWSDDDFLLAFRTNPLCMAYSEKKIRSVVDFYVNQIGLLPSFLAKTPTMLGLSLEKRIKPRCSVIAVLRSKGILKENFSYLSILTIGDKLFMDRFVIKYCEDVPQLLSVFKGKTGSLVHLSS